MIGRRTITNLIVFLGLTALLVYAGLTQFVFLKGGGQTLNLTFANAGGLTLRSDVTMRGVPVGAVTAVDLNKDGTVRVSTLLQPGITVPEGTKAEITRRSPIGDLVVELTPGSGKDLADGAMIPLADTTTPPDPEKTIEELARVLHSVPSKSLTTVVSELADAVRGRGEDLASLSETTADLPQRLLEIRAQLQSLIVNGPKVTGVLADNANALADDITQTAILADILRDNRFDLVDLSKNGATFANVANSLIVDEKANLSCLINDFADINGTLAEPEHLQDLASTLDLNHYFFDGVWTAVQTGLDGFGWFRVSLLSHTEPPGRNYVPKRKAPDVYMGNACHSQFGDGVGPATQPGPVWLANGSKLHPGG